MMENKNPLDGVTYHNVPIEDCLKHTPDKECLKEFETEVATKKNQIPPIHCKNKYKTKKEKNSMVKNLSQKEINKDYFMDNIKLAKSARELVICILLKGYNHVYTNNKLFTDLKDMNQTTFINRKIKIPKSITTIAPMTAKLMKSDLSKFIIIGKITEAVGKPGKTKDVSVNSYRMSEEGLNLKPQEAFKLGKGIMKKEAIIAKGRFNPITGTKNIYEEGKEGPTNIADNYIGKTTKKATDINIQIDNSIKSINIKINKKSLSNITDIIVSFN